MFGYCDPFMAMKRANGTCDATTSTHCQLGRTLGRPARVGGYTYSQVVTEGTDFSTLILKVVDEL